MYISTVAISPRSVPDVYHLPISPHTPDSPLQLSFMLVQVTFLVGWCWLSSHTGSYRLPYCYWAVVAALLGIRKPRDTIVDNVSDKYINFLWWKRSSNPNNMVTPFLAGRSTAALALSLVVVLLCSLVEASPLGTRIFRFTEPKIVRIRRIIFLKDHRK